MLLNVAVMLILGQTAVASGSAVTFLTSDQLSAALRSVEGRQQGIELAELAKQPSYSVLQIRRTTPGGSEVHAEWADVWYVVRGGATLVTGGTVVEGKTTEPGEIRGKAIAGGEQRQLKGGEVVVIPSGVPHWISKVEGEIVYLVVKAPSGRAGTK